MPTASEKNPRPRAPTTGATAAVAGGPSFSAVYQAHVDRVFGFIGYRTRTPEEAEDLTQVVFEKALRAWARFDPERGSAMTWLIAIARNVLIDFHRQRQTSPQTEAEQPEAPAAERPAHDRGLAPELADALDALNSREQTILALRFGADMTGPEIAELLALSTDNVHQILSRSLRKLRERLGERPATEE